jgi:MFS family permease
MTVTVAVVGSLIAPLIGPILQKRLGRKKTIMVAFGLFCLPSSFLQLFAYVFRCFVATPILTDTDQISEHSHSGDSGIVSLGRKIGDSKADCCSCRGDLGRNDDSAVSR